jgi:hypothetical protein
MKLPHIILFFILVECAFAQQKINLITYPNGATSFHLITKADTTYIANYPNSKIEAKCRIRNGAMQGSYNRWYNNGNKMWVKEMQNDKAQGKCSYYNTKGELLAELIYSKDTIADTLFLKPNQPIILGSIKYNSKVYGGVENADGSSNISENVGPLINYAMQVFKVDSLKKPQLINSSKSDVQGQFVIAVPVGQIAIYPATIKLDDIKTPYNAIPTAMSMSGNESWDLKLPIEIKKNEPLKIITLTQYSVGYAP